MKKMFLSALFVCLSAQFVCAVSITVYNDDFALVKDVKEFSLSKGEQRIEIDDVSSKIDPTSVLPKFLSDFDKINIYEQNFDFDLVNTNKLLQQYVGSNIEIERQLPNSKKEKLSGKLLAVNGGMVVKSDDKIILNPQGEVSLPKLPESLRLKPTLSWLINSKVSGKKEMEITYKTSGISWNADYVAVLDKNDKNVDINAWVTINNLSGATYNDADLKLVAGDVNVVREALNAPLYAAAKSSVRNFAEDAESSFQEKSFFEYHMYRLSRKTTIKNNEQKQIEFTSAQVVPAEKKYTYNGSGQKDFTYSSYNMTRVYSNQENKVEISLKLKNDKASKLGIALPKGKVRVFKNDGETIEFVGEDIIDHTPENKDIYLNLGNAFDITGERTQTNYKVNNDAKQAEESFSITIKNSKDENVNVEIIEPLYRWSGWKILSSSEKYIKRDSKTIVFNAAVPAKGEKKITYKVKYSW